MKNINYKIYEALDDFKSDYEAKEIQIIDGLYFSQYRTIRMCEFYANSTYIQNNGASRYGSRIPAKNKDGMGRDKPFYNIVNYRVSLAKTATDLDIKDIKVEADSEEYWIEAMLLNKEVYNWMKESNFSLTLNKMGYTRPKYGGYIAKKVFEDDEDGKEQLKVEVVEWKNVFTSQIDIMKNPIIERHYFTPVQLMGKSDVWENVTDVLKAHKKLKNAESTIEVYEMTGEYPKSFFLEADDTDYEDDDEFKFSFQKYFVAVVGDKQFKMHWDELPGKKMEDFYMYLPWEEMSGRGLGKGVIEDSEEAQVWTNDAVINEKNAMDLAGKVVAKTNSKKLANNILEVDNGKIFELGTNEDINIMNLVPGALGQFQNQIDKWKVQADAVTSSFDAATGEMPPSGTPYSTTALLNSVATKPFDYRREEWGIHLTQMFENWILPYIIKRIYDGHILRSEYSDDELKVIDEKIHASNHNDFVKSALLEGNIPSEMELLGVKTAVDKELSKYGKQRFIDIPEGFFDDIECGITIVTTGEQKNKAATLQSLSTILDTVIKSYNPQTGQFGVLENPKLAKIFGTIVELSGSGISPIGLGLGGSSVGGGGTNMSQPTQAPVEAPAQAQSTPLAPIA
jgi:hypothetical protein